MADRFELDDYFRIHRITEVALSCDGAWLAYATEVPSLHGNQIARHVSVQAATHGATPETPEELKDALDLAWVPGTQRLAYLSSRSGSSQIYSLDHQSGDCDQVTTSPDPVAKFGYAESGESLAYTTRAAFDPAKSLYNRFREDETGILIDTGTVSSHDFVNPTWAQLGHDYYRATVLWVCAGNDPVRVPVPGTVTDFFWSSADRWISVMYVADDIAPSILRSQRTSIGIYGVRDQSFQTFAPARPPANGKPGESFAGGEWVPGEPKIVVRRVRDDDPWVSWNYPDLAIVDAFRPLKDQDPVWHDSTKHGGNSKSRFHPVSATEVLIETKVNSVASFYKLDPRGVAPADVVKGLRGNTSLIRSSADRQTTVMVNESLTRPPEVYLRRDDETAQQVTRLNAALTDGMRASAREVSWPSKDGTTVRGWLVEPAGADCKAPWPLITHVHGGPGWAFPNAFAPYFSFWPYPFEMFSQNGIAVFFPNYRGTQTYERAIAAPRDLDGEPVDDVMTGVRHLVDLGVADPDRLGICGHSHGAWVGPLAMTRLKLFRAASFAEGTANEVLQYAMMPRNLNLEVHDVVKGASYYEAPQKYLEHSPDLHFRGVRTPTLFEAGAYAMAIHMLSFPKAAQDAGTPTELIVYPKTGHNVELPTLQRESAERNLDWFRFWLQGEEDPKPAKAEQYARWRAMAAEDPSR